MIAFEMASKSPLFNPGWTPFPLLAHQVSLFALCFESRVGME